METAIAERPPVQAHMRGPVRPVRVGELVLGMRERAYLQQVIDSNRLSYGPMTQRFESRFAKLHDCSSAVFCNSGTSALQLAIEALKEQRGWQAGDEVIVPAVTFVATVNVVTLAGLKPVLVDVDPLTYNIDPAKAADAITPRTRCILPVHLLGLPADMDPLIELARRHKLAIVEDSCETMFARYKGRSVGSLGDIGCFSTYVAHMLVTGVGGFATTRDSKLAVLLRSLMNHGRDNIYLSIDDDDDTASPQFRETVDRRFRFERVGFSYRCTELEAAIGLGQLDDYESIVAARRANAAWFNRQLADLSDVLQLPTQPPDRDHSYMVYGLVVRPESGLESMRPLVYHLEEHGIETRDMLPLIHQPVYRDWLGACVGERFPVAHHLYNRAFYVGCHQHMDEGDRWHVVQTIRRFFPAIANRFARPTPTSYLPGVKQTLSFSFRSMNMSLARTLTAGLVAAAVLTGLTGCQPSMQMETYSSFGPGVKYDGLGTTYEWSPAAAATMKEQEAERPYIHGLVLAAVDAEMKRKGYAHASGKADLWIAYEVNRREQVEGYSGEAYQAGLYGISIFDPETSRKIFSGAAKIRIDPEAPPQERKTTVDEATKRMLADFPASKQPKK